MSIGMSLVFPRGPLLRVGEAERNDDGGSRHSGQKLSALRQGHGSLLERGAWLPTDLLVPPICARMRRQINVRRSNSPAVPAM
jgi:hypothetical protein